MLAKGFFPITTFEGGFEFISPFLAMHFSIQWDAV